MKPTKLALALDTQLLGTATSNAPWITVTTGASGSGNGTVQYSVAANPGGTRTGTPNIAGITYTITQN